MAREVLSNGVINPDKYQADWYADLSNNWNLLNDLIGSAISGSEVDSKIATAIQELMIRTFQIVAELPATGTEGVMYLVLIPNTSKYTAYVWENNAYRELGVIQMTITIDDELSTTSENPAQNKVITNALNNKAPISHTHSASDITSGLATVATSGSYNDLSNKPTIPTVNNGTLTIQKNGANVQTFTANQSTNATANITVPTKTSDLTNDSGFITEDNTKIPLAGSNAISGSLIPSTDNSIDIGSSTKNLKMLYTKGITIDGTQFLPSDYIPRSGGAVITGTIFSRNDTNSFVAFRSGPNYADGASIQLKGKDQTDASGGRAYIIANNGTVSTTLTVWPTGEVIFNNALELKPSAGNSCDLGTSTNKWKSLNGINPGALSLPSTSMGINLDLTGFKLDGSDNIFRLTNFSNYPYNNGWLFVRLDGCIYYYLDHWFKVVSNGYANPITAIFFMPINDIDHDITLRCVCTSINYIRVFPCQGNV